MARKVVPRRLVEGIWGAWTRLADVQQALFERRLGVSTRGHLYLEDVGLADDERVFYEGSQWLPVHRALSSLHPGPDDVFVDLGCGRGQAVLIAGQLPFGRVVGVELAPVLTAEAQSNISAARSKLKAREVEAVTADALTWEIPNDLSVLYLYSPFTGNLFRRVMERIFASYDEHPRRLHVVYAFPWEHNWLMNTGRVVVRDLLPAQWPPKPWWWRTGWVTVIYKVQGGSDGAADVPQLRRRFLRPTAAVERWSRPNDNVFRLLRDGQVALRSDR